MAQLSNPTVVTVVRHVPAALGLLVLGFCFLVCVFCL